MLGVGDFFDFASHRVKIRDGNGRANNQSRGIEFRVDGVREVLFFDSHSVKSGADQDGESAAGDPAGPLFFRDPCPGAMIHEEQEPGENHRDCEPHSGVGIGSGVALLAYAYALEGEAYEDDRNPGEQGADCGDAQANQE